MNRRRILLTALAAFTPGLALAAGGGGEKKTVGGENYLPIPTLLGMTRKSRGGHGVLSVDCGLHIPDAKLRERANLLIPRLRASYVQIVQSYAAGLPHGALPNVEYLIMALQRQTNLALGGPGARVLLGAVVVN